MAGRCATSLLGMAWLASATRMEPQRRGQVVLDRHEPPALPEEADRAAMLDRIHDALSSIDYPSKAAIRELVEEVGRRSVPRFSAGFHMVQRGGLYALHETYLMDAGLHFEKGGAERMSLWDYDELERVAGELFQIVEATVGLGGLVHFDGAVEGTRQVRSLVAGGADFVLLRGRLNTTELLAGHGHASDDGWVDRMTAASRGWWVPLHVALHSGDQTAEPRPHRGLVALLEDGQYAEVASRIPDALPLGANKRDYHRLWSARGGKIRFLTAQLGLLRGAPEREALRYLEEKLRLRGDHAPDVWEVVAEKEMQRRALRFLLGSRHLYKDWLAPDALAAIDAAGAARDRRRAAAATEAVAMPMDCDNGGATGAGLGGDGSPLLPEGPVKQEMLDRLYTAIDDIPLRRELLQREVEKVGRAYAKRFSVGYKLVLRDSLCSPYAPCPTEARVHFEKEGRGHVSVPDYAELEKMARALFRITSAEVALGGDVKLRGDLVDIRAVRALIVEGADFVRLRGRVELKRLMGGEAATGESEWEGWWFPMEAVLHHGDAQWLPHRLRDIRGLLEAGQYADAAMLVPDLLPPGGIEMDYGHFWAVRFFVKQLELLRAVPRAEATEYMRRKLGLHAEPAPEAWEAVAEEELQRVALSVLRENRRLFEDWAVPGLLDAIDAAGEARAAWVAAVACADGGAGADGAGESPLVAEEREKQAMLDGALGRMRHPPKNLMRAPREQLRRAMESRSLLGGYTLRLRGSLLSPYVSFPTGAAAHLEREGYGRVSVAELDALTDLAGELFQVTDAKVGLKGEVKYEGAASELGAVRSAVAEGADFVQLHGRYKLLSGWCAPMTLAVHHGSVRSFPQRLADMRKLLGQGNYAEAVSRMRDLLPPGERDYDRVWDARVGHLRFFVEQLELLSSMPMREASQYMHDKLGVLEAASWKAVATEEMQRVALDFLLENRHLFEEWRVWNVSDVLAGIDAAVREGRCRQLAGAPHAGGSEGETRVRSESPLGSKKRTRRALVTPPL